MGRKVVIGQPVVEWASEICHCSTHEAIGFGVEEDGKLIAGVVFNEYNGANINMHVASDGSKRWMTKQLLWMVFDYAFNQAKVKRITGLVASNNIAARKFDEHIGFVHETTLVGAHPEGDLIVYRMFKSDCRWLKDSDEI